MEEKEICIDVLGDISLAYWEQAESQALYLAKMINEQLGEVDYRIANLEAPIVEGQVFPIDKSGPNLGINAKYKRFIEKLNIDGYTLANNHIGDYGEDGIRNTINFLDTISKDYVGSSLIYEKTYEPLRKEINGIKISFLSFCENEFGVASNEKIGAAGYSIELVKKSLKKESKWADYKIVIFHGGAEHFPFPTPGQKDRYHMLVDYGADAVVGMHTHCPAGYEIYRNSPIVYSVGNFFFPWKCNIPFSMWGTGYIARLKLKKNTDILMDIIPYQFDINGSKFNVLEENRYFRYIKEISNIIDDDNHMTNLYRAWAVMSGKEHFEQMCGCFGNLQNKKSFCSIKNMFSCETHAELLKTYLAICYEQSENDYVRYVAEIKKYMNFECDLQEGKNRQNQDVKRVVIWGIGIKAEKQYQKLKNDVTHIMFADKNLIKQGLLYFGEVILSPEDAIENFSDADFYLCTNNQSIVEIKEYLIQRGIKSKKIYIL